MKRFLQYPLGLLSISCVCAALLFLGQSTPGQAPAKLPTVDKIMHQAYVDKINDKVSFELVPIPGGTFVMGSPDNEKGRQKDEGPQHPVAIKPFWMGKFEVTWDEYDWYWSKCPGGPPSRPDISKIPKESDAITSPTPPYADETFAHGRDGNPVLAITHHAAMEYCRWLSEKTGKKYRLPTEAEWEWACRAGTTTAYSFGDDPAKLDDHAWYEKTSEDVAHKVGKKKANAWGLFDMHGNVAEWCIDRYQKEYYAGLALDKATLNPFNPPTENRYGNVARGGSWFDPPEKCRSSARRFSEKEWLRRDPQIPKSIWWMTEADWVGFRVVRDVEEDPRLKNIRSKVTWGSPD